MSQKHQKTQYLNETTPFVDLTSCKRERKKEIALRRKQKKIINMMEPFTENDGF